MKFLIRVGCIVLSVLGSPAGAEPKPATPPAIAPPLAHPFDRLRTGLSRSEVVAIAGSPVAAYESYWGFGKLGWVEFSANGLVSRIRKNEPIPKRSPPNLVVTGLAPSSPGDYYQQPYRNDVAVSGYRRRDGTWVDPYRRTLPNDTRNDNYSTRGNVNPYTGEAGTAPRDGEQPQTEAELAAIIERSRQLRNLVSQCEAVIALYNNQQFSNYTPPGQTRISPNLYEQAVRVGYQAKAELRTLGK